MVVLLQTRAIKTRGRLEVPSVVAASASSPCGQWGVGVGGGAALKDGATNAICCVPFIDLIHKHSCMYV